jgi:hypothetical protein
MLYHPVSDYMAAVRSLLQDEIVPYRYADTDIVGALNNAMTEISRIRPDMFLDLKYQNPLIQGDIRDGVPQLYQAVASGQSLGPAETVAIPSSYYMAVIWHMAGFLQLYDVTDTQDQRGAAFIERAKSMFLSIAL